jgi:hypothetical protein
MVNLERVEFLTHKLHDLLAQAQELKDMINLCDAENEQAPSSSDEAPPVSDTEVSEKKPVRRSWCCCFTRKPKLN